MLKRVGFHAIQEVRTQFCLENGFEHFLCLYVCFVKIDLEILTKLMVLDGFRHARAADARMWSAWFCLLGIRAM